MTLENSDLFLVQRGSTPYKVDFLSIKAQSSTSPFSEFTAVIDTDYTIAEGRNALSVGPIQISANTVVTLSNSTIWRIL